MRAHARHRRGLLPAPIIGEPAAYPQSKRIVAASMSQLDHKSEAWSALFSEPMSDLVKRYIASVFFDKRL